MSPPRPAWPDGARSALTIFDDTDHATVANTAPVYELLTDVGIRITKSVWPVAPTTWAEVGGGTCADPDYLAWVRDLRDAGHEIGFHNATSCPSTWDETVRALDRFAELFGHDPRIGADHGGNREALYWGPARLSGARALAYRSSMRLLRPDRVPFDGHVPASRYFWGDVCRERIDYWRNLTFADANVLRPCPVLPYHDPRRPYVNWWFASTHAPSLEPLLDLLRPERLDRLEAEGGACIAYTHLGQDAAPDGRVDPRLRRAVEALAERPGWFVPASTVLDHLRAAPGSSLLTDAGRRRMERHWVRDQVRMRGVEEAGRLWGRSAR